MRGRPPGRDRDREHALLHRIAVAVLVNGTLCTGAMAAMPGILPAAPVPAPPAGATAPPASRVPAVLPHRLTEASAYSAWDEGNFCPGFPQTRRMDLTVGSDLVPCGAHVRICLVSGARCVVAQRRDWGPGLTARRRLDINLGVVRALGYRSLHHWGARMVRWEPVDDPPRAVASAPRKTR